MPKLSSQCAIQVASVVLPTYTECTDATDVDFNRILSSPPAERPCLCSKTFAELGGAAMKRMQAHEEEMIDGENPTGRRESTGEEPKEGEYQGSMDGRRGSESIGGSGSHPNGSV